MATVSVVLPVHRNQPHLAETVRSICSQTLQDWELVLVDNGTRNGRDLLPSEVRRDERIRLVRLAENQGIACGINAGIAAASGEFIAMADYDDVSLPRRLEFQAEYLRAHPDVGLVNCGAETIDEQGRVTGREFCLIDGNSQLRYSGFRASVVAPVHMGRREVFLQLPHRPEFPLGSDYDFFTRAADRWKLGGVPRILYRYRRYPGQTSIEKREGHILNECAIRLVTARRRAGRSEELARLAREMSVAPLAETYRRYARWCAAEGYSEPAVYHARRLVAEARGAGDVAEGLRIFFRVAAANPRSSSALLRLMLYGPLRSQGLRDQGAELRPAEELSPAPAAAGA